MNLASEFERTIANRYLPGLEKPSRGAGFVLPHYEGYSIANLPRTMAGLLGAELEGAQPHLPLDAWRRFAGGARRVVLLILDAVGYRHFERLLDADDTALGRLARDGTFVPLTSVFPSTTMAAMSSLWTGFTPGDHGFLGRRLFLSDLGVLADMIRLRVAGHGPPGALLDAGWQPETFLPVPDFAGQLAAQGVPTVAHLYRPYASGGLTRLFLRSVTSIRGYLGLSDLWLNVRDNLIERPEERIYLNVYWHSTDDVAHTYGPDGERFAATLRQIAWSFDKDFMKGLPNAAREGTVLIVTADHGQIATPVARAVRLADHPELKGKLMLPPAAEPRAATLYVRQGQDNLVREYVAEHLADRFIVLDTDDAVAAGLFGRRDIPAESRTRLGDVLLLARADSQLLAEEDSPEHRGEHGSLTAEEMLVPLLMARLDG